jgi:hypothetical protein
MLNNYEAGIDERKPEKLRLTEISRERYGGGDGKAINKHSDRTYRDQHGNKYLISRNLSTSPQSFAAYGPIKELYPGAFQLLHPIWVNGKEEWGDDLSWDGAVQILCKAMNAEIVKED